MSGDPRHPLTLEEAHRRQPPDDGGFSAWLWRQRARPDELGQLAVVVSQDSFWQGAETREEAVSHVRRLGAKAGVDVLMGRAWDLWHDKRVAAGKRARAREKSKAQRQARKRSR